MHNQKTYQPKQSRPPLAAGLAGSYVLHNYLSGSPLNVCDEPPVYLYNMIKPLKLGVPVVGIKSAKETQITEIKKI